MKRGWATLAVLFGAITLPAQNSLVVEDKGKTKPVRMMLNFFMYVEEDGRLKRTRSRSGVLVPAKDFLPVFVTVRDISMSTSRLVLIGAGGSDVSYFHATFESPYLLEDVFFVLEVEQSQGKKRIHSQGVGRLTPNTPSKVSAEIWLPEPLVESQCQLHVFSQGMEVFHSGQPRQFRDRVLDDLVGKRIAGVVDAAPTPSIGPVPEYPKRLVQTGLSGEVVLKARITLTGTVADLEVVKTTDPAFGESALVAVRQWRFLPRVKNGQPVEAMINVPFAFKPQGKVVKD